MARAVSRWTELVDGLGLPEDGCTITGLVEQVARHRSRPIRLVPLADSANFSAMVVNRGDHDEICYRTDGGPMYQAHSVCHELGHLLLGHEPDRTPDGVLAGDPTGGQLSLLGGLGTADLILCRTTFEEEHEAHAETLAWVLLERTGRRGDTAGGALANALAPRRRRRR